MANQRPHSLPEKSAAPPRISTIPQMRRVQPHVVKSVVTRRPDSVTRKVSSFARAVMPWMMSMAPIVNITMAAKMTHPLHADPSS